MKSIRTRQGLVEQLRLLQASCRGYDQGIEFEAVRIATCLRVLFHDPAASRGSSLLTQQGMAKCEMLSTKHGVYAQGDHTAFVTYMLALTEPVPVRARPRFGLEFCKIGRDDWWNGEHVYRFGTRDCTRRDLVRAAADKEGGAHFDEESAPFYRELAEGLHGLTLNAAGITFSGPPPYDPTVPQRAQGTHYAMLRQFGHEVLATADNFGWTS